MSEESFETKLDNDCFGNHCFQCPDRVRRSHQVKQAFKPKLDYHCLDNHFWL